MGALILILTIGVPCALAGLGYWMGSKSERIVAVKHGLARWIPDDNGWTSFVWRSGLASEYECLIRDRDYHRSENEKAQAIIRELKSKQSSK